MTIPKDIQDRIEERFPDNNANAILGNNVKQMRQCAAIGYSLAAQQLEEKEKEIEKLRTLLRQYAEFYRGKDFTEETWQQFKTDNNL